MNVQRFVGRNARHAMALVRAACGEQALVLANRPVPGGVEILAMPAGDLPPVAPGLASAAPHPAAGPAAAHAPAPPPAHTPAAAASSAAAPAPAAPMSTISFQAYVQDRARRAAAQAAAPQPPVEPARFAREDLAALHEPHPGSPSGQALPQIQAPADHADLAAELRALRTSVTRQLAGLAWFDTARRNPAQTALLRLLLANGFSPALSRRLVERLPDDVGSARAEDWLTSMLAHNLRTSGDDAVLQRGGVWALVGPTGVGKTTTTAKLAARFAMQHGAASVGLITVDTYRMAGADQLRAFGRLINIPVHTARDAASLADLLQLFAGKKLVLVDTVGLAQRDRRLPELFAALPASHIGRLLVLNAGSSGEALEQVAQAYGHGPGTRCIVGKLDEAPGCGAVVDIALRHQFVVEGLATGQRVPEDWHAAQPPLLAQKALMSGTGAFRPDDLDVGLLLTAPPRMPAGAAHA